MNIYRASNICINMYGAYKKCMNSYGTANRCMNMYGAFNICMYIYNQALCPTRKQYANSRSTVPRELMTHAGLERPSADSKASNNCGNSWQFARMLEETELLLWGIQLCDTADMSALDTADMSAV